MITVRLAAEDLSRVRFAFSPLWETVASFRALLDPARHALHLPWIEATRGEVGGLDLSPLYALVLAEGYMPDFLAPPPATPLPSFEDEMERLEQTPAATVLEEVGLLREDHDGSVPGGRERLLGAYVEDPEGSLRRLAATLSRYHEIAIAPHWPRLRALLEADVLKRAQALAFGGPEALFRDLHPSVRYREGLVEVERAFHAEAESGGRGMLLVPCVFARPDLYAVTDAPWQPSLVYTPRGAARLWVASPAGAGEAIAAALGPGRASVLRELSVPRTTAELARQLGLSPGTAPSTSPASGRPGSSSPTASGVASSTATATRGSNSCGSSASSNSALAPSTPEPEWVDKPVWRTPKAPEALLSVRGARVPWRGARREGRARSP